VSTSIVATRRQRHPTTTKRAQFRERVSDALYYADFDTSDLTDQILQAIEQAIRRRFRMSGTEFDLSFSDLTRDISQLLDEKLAGAIDHDAAINGLCEEFLNGEKEPPPA
jgi:transcription termination factor NusB